MREELEANAGNGLGMQISNPIETVRATLQKANNNFAVLEDAAEELRREAKIESVGDFGPIGNKTFAVHRLQSRQMAKNILI